MRIRKRMRTRKMLSGMNLNLHKNKAVSQELHAQGMNPKHF